MNIRGLRNMRDGSPPFWFVIWSAQMWHLGPNFRIILLDYRSNPEISYVSEWCLRFLGINRLAFTRFLIWKPNNFRWCKLKRAHQIFLLELGLEIIGELVHKIRKFNTITTRSQNWRAATISSFWIFVYIISYL